MHYLWPYQEDKNVENHLLVTQHHISWDINLGHELRVGSTDLKRHVCNLKFVCPQQYLRLRKPRVPDMSHAGMSQMTQTNWKFVETLLKECKTKVHLHRCVQEKYLFYIFAWVLHVSVCVGERRLLRWWERTIIWALLIHPCIDLLFSISVNISDWQHMPCVDKPSCSAFTWLFMFMSIHWSEDDSIKERSWRWRMVTHVWGTWLCCQHGQWVRINADSLVGEFCSFLRDVNCCHTLSPI